MNESLSLALNAARKEAMQLFEGRRSWFTVLRKLQQVRGTEAERAKGNKVEEVRKIAEGWVWGINVYC